MFVTGEVLRPGQYPLKSDRTLLALLGDVGGLGPNAGHEVIVVRPPRSLVDAPELGAAPPSGATASETVPATEAATASSLPLKAR